MPKGGKAKKTPALRHSPLGNEIEKPVGKLRAPRSISSKVSDEDYVEDDDKLLIGESTLGGKKSSNLEKSIIKQANSQLIEESRPQSTMFKSKSKSSTKSKVQIDSEDEDSPDEDDQTDDDELSRAVHFQGDFVEVSGSEMAEGNALSSSEERVVSQFLSAGSTESRNLVDIILQKIREKEQLVTLGIEGEDQSDSGQSKVGSGPLPPKVIEVYSSVGKMLKHYTSGKLPRALKMLPHLEAWEEVMWLTRPDEWSPVATYACTRIFASNLNAKLSQRFFNLVLLEKCRDDIREHAKLNYHLYMALKKALYKPSAFYKGILLPLALSGNCSLREAAIFGSVVAKASIQPLHSAAALLKLAQIPYSGSTSYLIKVLLNKKYALPKRVVEGLVDHFSSFEHETRVLPVIWHQSLLVLAQRYKLDLDESQRERIRSLLKNPNAQHNLITPEVRREIFSAASGARPVLPADMDL